MPTSSLSSSPSSSPTRKLANNSNNNNDDDENVATPIRTTSTSNPKGMSLFEESKIV